MSGVPATFWSAPIRYVRWAFYQKPAIAWSVAMVAFTPTLYLWGPPLRRALGDDPIPPLPMSYPVPTGPRKRPAGFEDP